MSLEEEGETSIAEEISDTAAEETEEKKAITRSIHITTQKDTNYTAVTVTTQDKDEDIQKILKIAEKLMDKYINFSNIRND